MPIQSPQTTCRSTRRYRGGQGLASPDYLLPLLPAQPIRDKVQGRPPPDYLLPLLPAPPIRDKVQEKAPPDCLLPLLPAELIKDKARDAHPVPPDYLQETQQKQEAYWEASLVPPDYL